ncbi:hypothetical protein [Sinorhizobium fredii]|uniref:hypothetical protein n=1 Tax=Rhizobium fredii TaxID=380 RepID=UPI003517387E
MTVVLFLTSFRIIRKTQPPTASAIFFALQKRVIEHGAAAAMSIQRCGGRNPQGAFVTKFWKPVNRPIFDDEGRLVYVLLHHVEDVTTSLRFSEMPNRRSRSDFT